MRSQTISAICLLLTGLAGGLFFSSGRPPSSPTGDLMPRERAVEAGMNVDVDLRIRNRPLASRIKWYADKGAFNPEETETDLRSVFTAPPEQGKVRLWVDVVDEHDHVYQDVASTYIDVSRPAVNASAGPPPSLAVGPVFAKRPAVTGNAIKFITIPPYDGKGGPTTSADIEGEVEGLKDPEQYRVVLYARTDNTWWVQPLAAARYTALDRNGQFLNWTHTGTRYAALLVRKGFVAPEAIDGELPSGPDVLARQEVNGKRKGE
jgi:hypothetical protein